jgi:hypothetical protein
MYSTPVGTSFLMEVLMQKEITPNTTPKEVEAFNHILRHIAQQIARRHFLLHLNTSLGGSASRSTPKVALNQKIVD